MDFTRGNFKPKSASSILQALSCRFVSCNCVIEVNSWSPKVKIPRKVRRKPPTPSASILSKPPRRALAFCFSVGICCKYLTPKCRGESELGLCMTSGFAKRMPLRRADFQFSNVFGRRIRRNLPLRHSFCNTRSHAQTYISLSSTFWQGEHVANLYGKTKCY